ncbi:basic secretory family protein [Luteolibacter sp. GHJ8]|uniref:Basic secretory family protein n=1 Tax=Luteolibacter rhizosphaerae TaxID=2989719 RepID=A0ABT3G655_9BACT|nr:basic secretory family protein [Luteolibacter rhizosphaerae]MCW1915326.1 basic secretory family protein [Luteolibacter rhizosphaerae]
MHPSSIVPLLIGAISLTLSPVLSAAANVVKAQGSAEQGFKLDPIAPPAINDAAAKAVFTLVDGAKDEASGELSVLNDGKVPTGASQPASNFIFDLGTPGGRIAADLGELVPVKSVVTYSWHGGICGPQVYKLYAANGRSKDFDPAPKRGVDPTKFGWVLLANVDTRPEKGEVGGQHAAEINNKGSRSLGDYRYLLFDVERPSESGPKANTFFSEIDVISARGPEIERLNPEAKIVREYKSKDGKYRYIIISTEAPDLTEWSEKELVPVILEWYPKLVELLPSKGYRAPDVVTFEYKRGIGPPAYAAGNRITMKTEFYQDQLTGEAKGCTVHEMGHVVQNYWRANQTNRKPKETPGWVTEGICDYIRWFLFEPKSRGAGLGKDRADSAKYSDSYRVTGNFIDWVVTEKDEGLLQKLNAVAREGDYEEKLWKEWTGKTLEELGEEWKTAIKRGKREQ